MKKLVELLEKYHSKKTDHRLIIEVLQGWNAYAKQGNTYHLRQRFTTYIRNQM